MTRDPASEVGSAKALMVPLFVPADRPERIAKAVASGADAVAIDLEDAVAPEAKKGARAALADLPPQSVPVIVRVNAPATAWHADDVAVVVARPDFGLMLPKAEDPALVDALGRRLGKDRMFIPLVESALGIHRAAELARASGVTQLAFGPADFCNDIACDASSEALLLARSTLVIAARVGDLSAPIDGPCFDFRDPARTREEARHAEGLGFGGKLAIHPAQVPWIRAAFSPTEAEIAWARRVVAGAGGGAVAVDGVMVDAPLVARARRILARSP